MDYLKEFPLYKFNKSVYKVLSVKTYGNGFNDTQWKKYLALVISNHLHTKKVCSPHPPFKGGRSQKRLMRTALTLAYILGVGDNEKKNGDWVKNSILN